MAIEVELPPETVEEWRERLVSPKSTLPDKYKALFQLRNAAGVEAEQALLDGADLCLSLSL
jgi:hypothetical protein